MIQILKNIPFFAQLSEDDLQSILGTVQMQYFPANHLIFSQGDSGEMMYIIKRGKVQVRRDGAILAELSDNDFFGEMALVSDEPRNATVETLEETEVLTLAKDDFKRLISTNPAIASTISYEVIKRSER